MLLLHAMQLEKTQERARGLYMRAADLLEQLSEARHEEEEEGEEEELRKGGGEDKQHRHSASPNIPARITIDTIAEVSNIATIRNASEISTFPYMHFYYFLQFAFSPSSNRSVDVSNCRSIYRYAVPISHQYLRFLIFSF